MMQNDYAPHYWVILKVTDDTKAAHYRVLAGWCGGYVGVDTWRLNSGITHFEEDSEAYLFYGETGSCYRCVKGAYGLSRVTKPILRSFQAKHGDDNVVLLEDDTCIEDLVF